mgnify:CR=1 FL=1
MKRWLDRLAAFARLGRFHFLASGSLFYLLGVLIARYAGVALRSRVFWVGWAAVIATELVTHFGNDYFDLAADRANRTPTRFSGGSRVLVEGRLAPRVALISSLICAALSVGLTLYLVLGLRTGPWTLPLVLLGLLATWSYSGPPLRLQHRGWGELMVAIGLPLVPLVGFYLQAGRLAWLPVLATLPLCGLMLALTLAIDFPDAAGDASAGKRTILVRLGGPRGAWLHNGALALAYLAIPAVIRAGAPSLPMAALVLLAPLGVWQGYRFARGDWLRPPAWNSLEFGTIMMTAGGVLLELVGFAWLIAARGEPILTVLGRL